MALREIESTLPPGFRFYPSDEELVCHYLYKKVANERIAQGTLVEVDLHAREPWELPGQWLASYSHPPPPFITSISSTSHRVVFIARAHDPLVSCKQHIHAVVFTVDDYSLHDKQTFDFIRAWPAGMI
jgi:hypothetical protein